MQKEFIPQKLPILIDIETKEILKIIIATNKAVAELKGVAKTIPNQSILINALTLQEAKDSSGIENIITTHDELYRANWCGANISNQTKEVQRYREALFRGFELVQSNNLLLRKHIVEIQEILESNKAGMRTQAGTVLKNEQNGEVVYMPPQNPADIEELMSNLEKYINTPEMDDFDALVKMAIIHYQFESIHPFYDGNGRTGRIINILFLMLSGLLELPILYLSSYIIRTKSEYYRLLNAVRINGAWGEWIEYILTGVEKTAKDSIELINNINILMESTKEKLSSELTRIYSKDLLELIFSHPYTKINYLVDELRITRKTASSYLKSMEDIGIIKSIKIGRERYFINIALFELLKNQ